MFGRKKNPKVIKISDKRRKGKSVRLDNRIMTIAIIVAAVLGVLIAFRPNAYKIIIDGQEVGAVGDKKIIEGAKESVRALLEDRYGTKVQFEDEVNGGQELQIKKYRARKKDYIDSTYLISYMREHMNILLKFKEIFVEGEPIGIVASDEEVDELKAELKKKYYGNKEVEVEFGKDVEVKDTFAKETDLIPIDKLVQKCTATTPKSVTYTVQTGDTLSGIASHLGISIDDLVSANQGMTSSTTLRIGDILKAKVHEPLLPLKVVKHEEETSTKDESKDSVEEDNQNKADSAIN